MNYAHQAGSSAPRVAVIAPGGVAPPESGLSIPALVDQLHRLSGQFRLTVYSLAAVQGSPSRFELGNIDVIALPADHYASLPRKTAHFLARFHREHRRDPYQLVHGIWAFPGGWMAVLMKRLYALPALVSLQGGEAASIPEIEYGNMYHPRLRRLTLRACRNATALTALTRYQRRLIEAHGRFTAPFHIIPYGADPGRFPFYERRFSPPWRFLHVANLTEVKNQQMLLQVFGRLCARSRCELRVIGPDYLNGRIQQLATAMGLADRVHFLGKLDHDSLPEHYRWAHALLHTSHYEGQGVIFAEAAASGTLICGTRVGLLADLEDSCALSVEPGDTGALAAGVADLLGDSGRCERMVRAAAEWAAAHTASWSAGRMQEVYRETIAASGRNLPD